MALQAADAGSVMKSRHPHRRRVHPVPKLRFAFSVVAGILASLSVTAIALAEGVNGPLPK